MPELKLLFLQMAVILAAARLLGSLFRRIGQPEVIGEMAAGILLGPSLLGRVAPGSMASLFPPAAMGPLYALSQLGLVLFMFLVGLEFRPSQLRGHAKAVILASQASIAAPFVLGSALGWTLYDRFGSGSRVAFVMFLGAAMGITAFPVLARILADRKLTQTRVGQFAISCAAFDDLTAWCLLAVITLIARPQSARTPLGWRFAALAGYLAAMLFVVRPAMRLARHGLFGPAMILLLLSAWATETLGVHALFGAFLAGVVMPKDGAVEEELHGRIDMITRMLLLPLFFAYTGLRTSVGLLNSIELWLLCAAILTVAVGSKLLVSALVVRASGMPWREAFAVGLLVNTRGLVELVILNVGLDLHILSPTLFSMMVIMALLTTFMTTPLLDRLMTRSR